MELCLIKSTKYCIKNCEPIIERHRWLQETSRQQLMVRWQWRSENSQNTRGGLTPLPTPYLPLTTRSFNIHLKYKRRCLDGFEWGENPSNIFCLRSHSRDPNLWARRDAGTITWSLALANRSQRTMQLVVQSVTIEDFDILETYGTSPQGDLISPILDASWKVSSPAEKVARNTWGIAQQREIFLKDPTAIFLKVVDKESNEIISLARWHHYLEGFRYPEHARLEFDAFTQSEDDASWPAEINAALYRGLTSSCFSTRQQWQKPGPSWGIFPSDMVIILLTSNSLYNAHDSYWIPKMRRREIVGRMGACQSCWGKESRRTLREVLKVLLCMRSVAFGLLMRRLRKGKQLDLIKIFRWRTWLGILHQQAHNGMIRDIFIWLSFSDEVLWSLSKLETSVNEVVRAQAQFKRPVFQEAWLDCILQYESFRESLGDTRTSR